MSTKFIKSSIQISYTDNMFYQSGGNIIRILFKQEKDKAIEKGIRIPDWASAAHKAKRHRKDGEINYILREYKQEV